ncbi:MAG TPA: dihydroneopterin aldolase [Propionibacteriaceae bacterium]
MAAEALERAPERKRAPAVDRITLTGIAAIGHHGVFDFEREQGQRFVVDVTLTLDLAPAASTDDLAQTIDYGTLATAIVADIQGEPLDLIEALADRIARTTLRAGAVECVEVTVHKPQAPVGVEFADVAVTLTRSRRYD